MGNSREKKKLENAFDKWQKIVNKEPVKKSHNKSVHTFFFHSLCVCLPDGCKWVARVGLNEIKKTGC